MYKKREEDKINKLSTLTLNHFLAAILLAAEEVGDAVMYALAQLRVRLHALQQQPVEVAVALKRFDRCYIREKEKGQIRCKEQYEVLCVHELHVACMDCM